MTPALVLLARAATDSDEAFVIVPRLDLTRRPYCRADRLELEAWNALAPILNLHPGDRVKAREQCPPRWRDYLDTALMLPAWFRDRSEPSAALVARWNERGSRGWELPAHEPARITFRPDLLLREAA